MKVYRVTNDGVLIPHEHKTLSFDKQVEFARYMAENDYEFEAGRAYVLIPERKPLRIRQETKVRVEEIDIDDLDDITEG